MTRKLIEAQLSRDAKAPSEARKLLTERLTGAVDRPQVETAALLTSELVTNAIRHGQGEITLQAGLYGDRLRVEVIDEGASGIRDRDLSNAAGWGLKIVDAESIAWGTGEGTTHVWFELAAS